MKTRISMILRIIGFALGGGTSIYFFLNQQLGKGIVAVFISILWGIVLIGGGFIKEVKNRIDERLKKKADVLAELIVGESESVVLKLWWKVTSPFQRNYYKALTYRYRTYRTEGLKTKGKFALDMMKVFVPLRVAAESPDLISAEIIQGRETSTTRLEIWDFLSSIPSHPAYRRIAVLGSPGSGKTTLLEYLALTFALNTQRQQRRRVPTLVPILLYLRDIRDEITSEQPPNLAQLIEHQVLIQRLNPPPDWVYDKLRSNSCLVMLDGLDEVADEAQRDKVSRWINQQMKDYGDTPFVLTSRPFGYRNAPLNEIGIVLEIQPFSLREIEQFVHNWYLQSEIMRQVRKEDQGVREAAKKQADDLNNRIRNSPPLAAMAVNPLLLTMIATVHDNRGALPGRRVELYAEICDVLLGRRQEAKNIADSLTAKQKQAVLEVLALELMQRETRKFTLEIWSSTIQSMLATVADTTVSPKTFLKHCVDVTGLIVERELGVYEFAHMSFQEYLAATQVKEVNQENILIRSVNKPWWRETILLYAAQSDATNLIRAALSVPTVNAIALARDCVEEGARVSPEIRQELEDKLEAGLGSHDPEIARLAAEVKLSRRLHKLLRIDENVEIDTNCVTCSEYQLFINEELKEGRYHQPDHWATYKYPQGDQTKPIAGVRTSDATDFCEWLNKRYLNREFNYRLPTLTEAEENPIINVEIGCWCQVEKRKFIAGISPDRLQTWGENFVQAFLRDIALISPDFENGYSRIIDHMRDLPFDRALDIAVARDRAPDRDRAFARNRRLKAAFDKVLVRTTNRDLVYLQDLVRTLALAIDVDRHAYNAALTSANKLTLKGDVDSSLSGVRFYLLISCIAVHFYRYKEKPSLIELTEFFQQLCESFKSEYLTRSNVAFGVYVYFVLMTERRQGRIPAWEGIRIVRERIIH